MDYYTILGVKKDASKKEIKKAYLNLAKIYHPDRCKDSDATKKFQDINTAYEMLYDDRRRRDYDNLTYEQKVELYDTIKKCMVRVFPTFDEIFQKVVSVYYGDESDLRDDINSFNFRKVYNNIINRIGSNKTEGIPLYKQRKTKVGLNIYITIYTTLADRCKNRFKRITVKRKSIEDPLVKIVPLCEDESVFEGCGETDGTKFGDLIVVVNCDDDPLFKQINNTDLVVTQNISLYEYIYGSTLSLKHPDGEYVKLEFKSLLDVEPVFRVEKRGIPIYSGPDTPDIVERGVLYIVLKVDKVDEIKSLIHSLFPPLKKD